MNNFFVLVQAITSVILIGLILLQSSSSSSGGIFGGGGGGETYHTRKGVEKLFFYATIVLGILFVLNSLFLLIY